MNQTQIVFVQLTFGIGLRFQKGRLTLLMHDLQTLVQLTRPTLDRLRLQIDLAFEGGWQPAQFGGDLWNQYLEVVFVHGMRKALLGKRIQ